MKPPVQTTTQVQVQVLLALAPGIFRGLLLPLVAATCFTSDFVAVTLDGEEGPYHTGTLLPRTRGPDPAAV